MFIPCYLDGADGIFNLHYYDLLVGLDLTIYPSYYEPWGYTPLESVAFHVPCITTTLAGFGMWVGEDRHLDTDGVEVIERTDYNYSEVADRLADEIVGFAALDKKQVETARKAAAAIAQKALWKNFSQYYQEAYKIALERAQERNKS
jgi:glycosyltransferase involved in cell wall biosynthesis